MENDVFGFGADEWFANPLVVPPEVGRTLAKSGFEGIRIGGPSYIDLARFGTFPIAAVRVEESRKASQHLFKEYALLVAIETATGDLQTEFFVEQKFKKVKRDPVNNPPPPGKHSESASADLFGRLDLPRTPGEYLVNVILLDKISNRLRVRLDSGPPSNDKEFQNRVFSQAGARDSNPYDVHVSYKVENKPASVTKQPGEPVLGIDFQGAPDNQDARLLIKWINPVGERALEKMVWVIATRSRVPAPLIWPIRLRVPDEGTLGAKHVQQAITIKVADLPGLEGKQEYWFYALSGEHLSGPAKREMK